MQQELKFFTELPDQHARARADSEDDPGSFLRVCEDLVAFGLLVRLSKQPASLSTSSFYSTSLTVDLNCTKAQLASPTGSKFIPPVLSKSASSSLVETQTPLLHSSQTYASAGSQQSRKFLVVETTFQLYALTASPYLCECIILAL